MAAKHDFILDQGATWVRTFNCTKTDGTAVDFGAGASAKMQFRAYIGAPTNLFEAACVIATPASGVIVATVLPAMSTAVNLFQLESGKATENSVTKTGYMSVYDLEVTFGDTTKIRVVEGNTCITPEVTLD